MEFVTHAAEDTSLCAEVLELLRLHHETAGADADATGAPPPEQVGPWRIVGWLGRGGMGIVYRAVRDDGTEAALKVLDAGVLSARSIGRFRREAEMLRRLAHPGIARFLEAGSYESPVGPRPFYAMELVEGPSLRSRARDETWTVRERLAFVADLADALHHAHEHGIVHRDLKPENVVVTAGGKPKVLDFGVALVTADELRAGTLATATGVLLGTVRYMSPEQAQGLSDEIDRRSDVYALGVLAYELLSGVLPYEVHTRSVTRALVQVATLPPRPLGEARPSLRGPVERVVAHALAKRPADRYPDAAELAADLRRHLAGERVRAPGPSLPRRAWRTARSRPGAAVAALAGGLALLALAGRLVGTVSDTAREARADRATARACELLDSVDVRLHHEPRTVASLERSLALLREVARTCDRIGDRPYVPGLRRYAAWREGEALFFRARIEDDPSAYVQAAAAWARARDPVGERRRAPALPDTAVPIYPRMLALWPHQADAGISHAYAEAAREMLPARHSALALAHARAAWERFARGQGLPTDPFAPRPRVADPGVQARLLNEVGAGAGSVAYSAADPLRLDAALGVRRAADRVGGLDDDPAAWGSLRHHLGEAWLRRGHLLRDAASLDSATAHLGPALAERSSLPGNPSEVKSRLALATALRFRARLGTAPHDPRPWLERALRVLEPAAGPGGIRDAEGLLAARLTVARAAVRVDLALLDGDTLALARAETALEDVRNRFPRGRLPMSFARLERERGRAAAARWLLTGSRGARAAALAAFGSSGDALTLAQHRPFRIDNEAALQGLTRPRGQPVRLDDPVVWP